MGIQLLLGTVSLFMILAERRDKLAHVELSVLSAEHLLSST